MSQRAKREPRGGRRAVRDEDEDEPEEQPRSSSRGQKRGAPSRGAGEQQRGAPSPRGAGRNPSDQDAKRRNAQRVFKLYTNSLTNEYVTDPVKSEVDVAAELVKDKERETAEKLAPEEVKKLVMKMARYLAMRGSQKRPVLKSKLAGAVMGDYKKTKILNFVFGEAQKILRSVWGYDIVPAPKCGQYKGGLKDAWYVVFKDCARSVTHAELAAHGLAKPELRERALCALVLSLIQSSGGALREKELYRNLHTLDPAVPDDPPTSAKSAKADVAGLGNVVELLEGFREQHFVIKERDSEDEWAFSLGPRALVDLGRFQITQIQADALGQAVDPAIIKELEDNAIQQDEDQDQDQPQATQ